MDVQDHGIGRLVDAVSCAAVRLVGRRLRRRVIDVQLVLRQAGGQVGNIALDLDGVTVRTSMRMQLTQPRQAVQAIVEQGLSQSLPRSFSEAW